jgi:hypothetical protein
LQVYVLNVSAVLNIYLDVAYVTMTHVCC